jgi:uncharacterized protein YcbK (DUF882 family)
MNSTKNHFSKSELSCPCCGEDKFNRATLARFNSLRDEAGFPMPMTSGYRCEAYNESKGWTQTHATGQAGDISCTHERAFNLLTLARKHGFTGIGISQEGSNRFIHLDDLPELLPNRPRPHVWSY